MGIEFKNKLSALSIWNKPKWKNYQFWVFKKIKIEESLGLSIWKIGIKEPPVHVISKTSKNHCVSWKNWQRTCGALSNYLIFFKINNLRIGDMLPMYSGVWKKNLLLSLNFSQIWLNPFVNDYQSTYVTKFGKKKPQLSTLKTTLIPGEGFGVVSNNFPTLVYSVS
jgi:hypothetical protein